MDGPLKGLVVRTRNVMITMELLFVLTTLCARYNYLVVRCFTFLQSVLTSLLTE